MPYSAGFRRAIERAKAVRYHSEANDPTKPDFECDSYERMVDSILFMRCIYGGTKMVRDTATTLLPQHPSEEEEDYQRRLARAVFYNATKRTVAGLVGMIFRKEPQWEDTPNARIAEESLNIDLMGHDIGVYARMIACDALLDGHTWIVVDMPRMNETPASAAEERAMGIRPYWVQVKAEDAINVQWDIIAGEPRLRIFAYRGVRSEADGEFGEAQVEFIRVLKPGSAQEFTHTENGWEPGELVPVDLDYIPVAFVPAQEVGPFESEPPLLDLGYENVDHYQIRSDHRHAAMFASTPMPVFTGMARESVEWGPNRALFLPDAESSAMMLESSGASLASTRQDLKDSEARMASYGLQMLVGEKRAAETEQAKLIGKAESDSTLAAMAKSIQDGLNRAFEIHADWTNTDPVALALNMDFHEAPLDAGSVTTLSNMVMRGQLSLETMWASLVAGEVLPDGFDPELERERIDEEGAMAMPMLPPAQPVPNSEEERNA